MPHDFQSDIDAVSGIPAVQTILDVVCRTTGMRFAAVARVTDDRWVACDVYDRISFGLAAGGELDVTTTLCNEVRRSRESIIIDSVAEDESFCGHPTPAQYGFQSYISVPIVLADGTFFGTLCAIDPRPAHLKNPETIGMFTLFAQLIASQLDSNERYLAIDRTLKNEQHISELREQFIAVLGHDLRNPVFAIEAGTRMLLRTSLNERALLIVSQMQNSVERINALINDVLDFARGRLGNGIEIKRSIDGALQPALQQVVDELQSIHPDSTINVDLQLDIPVQADCARLSQMVSNLLKNALTHGETDTPVTVRGFARDGILELSVANRGRPIPPSEIDAIFEPFSRSKTGINQQGLGLGLYIASEIALSHGGTLDVESAPDETCFTFRMPLVQKAGSA